MGRLTTNIQETPSCVRLSHVTRRNKRLAEQSIPNEMSHQETEEVIETQQLTTFHENATVVNNDVRDVMPYTETLSQLVDNNDVTDFLGRPQIVATGDWTTSDISNAVLSSGSIATLLESQQIWYRKIAGYRMIRGKAHLRLAINANPFQQGRLLLHCLPCARDYNATYYTTAKNFNLCQKTQQPSIELDAQETSCELTVPYVAPTMFYDRVNQEFDWGTYYLSVLSPLKVGASGQNNIEWTLFLFFTEVELSGPIFGPESSSHSANARLQSEKKKIVRTGEISTLLDKVSRASGIFDDVPVIGTVASTLATYAGKFSDALSIFGWSKPNSDQTAKIMTLNPTRNFMNCDGENYADVFALNHSGALPICSGWAGTDVDEMSFAYLKKIKAYFSEFTWNSSAVRDVSLYQLKVGPKNIYQEGTIVTGPVTRVVRSAPPFAWLSKMFRYYRGGIKLTFKLIKTPFHSGRLLISFSTNDSSLTNGQSTYVLREIVDVRSTNEFTMVIPYIRATNYIETDLTDFDGDEYSTLGTVTVRVLNELRNPETVANNISVLVYASAADDFELAYPQNYRQVTYSPQSNIQGDFKMEDKPIGNSSHERSDIINNNMTIGDPFTSIKQLTNTYRKLYFPGTAPSGSASMRMWPFALNTHYQYPNLTDFSAFVGDYLSELAHGYVLSRGSVRLAVPRGSTDFNVAADLVNENRSVSAPIFQVGVVGLLDSFPNALQALVGSSAFNRMSQVRNSQWGWEVLVPHYGQTPSRLNYMGDNKPDQVDVNTCDVHISYTAPAGVNPDLFRLNRDIYRSGGDDYCLGYFVGFNPYMVSQTTS